MLKLTEQIPRMSRAATAIDASSNELLAAESALTTKTLSAEQAEELREYGDAAIVVIAGLQQALRSNIDALERYAAAIGHPGRGFKAAIERALTAGRLTAEAAKCADVVRGAVSDVQGELSPELRDDLAEGGAEIMADLNQIRANLRAYDEALHRLANVLWAVIPNGSNGG